MKEKIQIMYLLMTKNLNKFVFLLVSVSSVLC